MIVIYKDKCKHDDLYFKLDKIYNIYLKEEYFGISNYYIKDEIGFEWRFMNIEKEFIFLNNIRKEKLKKLNSL